MPVTHEDARIPNLVLINPRHAIVFYTQISVESGGMKNARILCEPGVALFPMLEVLTFEATHLLHEGVVTIGVWRQMRKLFFELLQQFDFPNAFESTVLHPCRATQNALLV